MLAFACSIAFSQTLPVLSDKKVFVDAKWNISYTSNVNRTMPKPKLEIKAVVEKTSSDLILHVQSNFPFNKIVLRGAATHQALSGIWNAGNQKIYMADFALTSAAYKDGLDTGYEVLVNFNSTNICKLMVLPPGK